MKIFLNTTDIKNPTIEITNNMKTKNYNELRTKLFSLERSWRNQEHENYARVLDANWVCVTIPNWRDAKAAGAKKDGYYGWVLWAGSTDDSGTKFANEVSKICNEYDVNISERQL